LLIDRAERTRSAIALRTKQAKAQRCTTATKLATIELSTTATNATSIIGARRPHRFRKDLARLYRTDYTEQESGKAAKHGYEVCREDVPVAALALAQTISRRTTLIRLG